MASPTQMPFNNQTADYTPINQVIAVTPSDVTDLQFLGQPMPSRAMWCNGTGNLTFDDSQGNTVTLAISVTQAGTIIWIRAKRIRATLTTVTGIFALY